MKKQGGECRCLAKLLSGHAHLYQRFTRLVDGREIPDVIAGSGGFAATRRGSTQGKIR